MVNSFFIDYIIQDFCLRNTTSSAQRKFLVVKF